MMTYEPLKEFMRENGLTFYDLHQTSLPHGTIYKIRNDETVSLPSLNYLMYCLGLTSLDQVIKYYRDGEDYLPEGVQDLETCDEIFDKFYVRKKNQLILPKKEKPIKTEDE